jgi:hypothetical protein
LPFDVRIFSFAGCFSPPDANFHLLRSLSESVSGLLTASRLFQNPGYATAARSAGGQKIRGLLFFYGI